VGEGLLTLSPSTLEQVAGVVGTPAYVYHADVMRDRYRELDSALSSIPHRICYSVKANSNLAVLQVLRSLGAGADIVSGGEMVRALKAGFEPDGIVFSGVGKTRDEISAALHAGIGLVNLESSEELQVIDEVSLHLGVEAQLGIRVNPDVATETHPYTQTGERGMKFGVPMGEVIRLARWIDERRNLTLRSIGMHIGSQIGNAESYREGAGKLGRLVAELGEEGLGDLQSVDVGGGLGITYTDEHALNAEEFADAVESLVAATGLTLLLEPGRFIVGNAGVLLARCLYRKRSGGRNFAVVDAAMNDLIRPSLYGAIHGIRPVSVDRGDSGDSTTCDVVGPICETGDFLGIDRELGNVEAGSLLAVTGAGAYGFTMSSTYNSRPRAAEVMVDGERWAVVRERETLEDLMRGEMSVEGDSIDWRQKPNAG
jgi:diaminopimelate decarboxylase